MEWLIHALRIYHIATATVFAPTLVKALRKWIKEAYIEFWEINNKIIKQINKHNTNSLWGNQTLF